MAWLWSVFLSCYKQIGIIILTSLSIISIYNLRLIPLKIIVYLFFLAFILSCNQTTKTVPFEPQETALALSQDILDYRITPKDSSDRSGFMFSDQGSWFAYSLPKTTKNNIGFSGPFLMTQENGVWSSPILSNLSLSTQQSKDQLIHFNNDLVEQHSYSSHLSQLFRNSEIELKQELVYISGHTALQRTTITNNSKREIPIQAKIHGQVFDIGMKLYNENGLIKLVSKNSEAIGYIQLAEDIEKIDISNENTYYSLQLKEFNLQPGESKEIIISQTFIFPEYSWDLEKKFIAKTNFDSILKVRQLEKEIQLKGILDNRDSTFNDTIYAEVLIKAHLTLQNNWRIAAGALKHEGLFPSYHYQWFNGFWAWDSWKHAVGLSYFNIPLAKNQMRAMFDFQLENGFILDCIFRDTTIEAHNYRDTKPPLAAWAVSEIHKKDKDLSFLKEFYPKLKKYHYWWYKERDHDQDGLCEFGSTDGSLIAAKWESGMDNAIRFDDSKILKNAENAYSLDQESVDLNAYLYAEKIYLSEIALILDRPLDSKKFTSEAIQLKQKIQSQFYDPNDKWFYDTNLEGTVFIKGEGSEGWTALWANAATQEQAEEVKNIMMQPEKFFTKVPFQTMSADHPKFNPLNGYWRGPNWLDQAYFGVKGLRNYGFNIEADKATIQIINSADGLLEKGKSIRENYHPITGEGLNAENFSWSAAHIIMLLLKG